VRVTCRPRIKLPAPCLAVEGLSVHPRELRQLVCHDSLCRTPFMGSERS